MSLPEHSRNLTAGPERPLLDVVDLPGWEDGSVWGWDQNTGSFYAQLRRNGSTADAPEIWLAGAPENYPRPGCIALEIVERTKAPTLAVVQALGIAHPEPSLRTEDEIMRRGSNCTSSVTTGAMSVASSMLWPGPKGWQSSHLAPAPMSATISGTRPDAPCHTGRAATRCRSWPCGHGVPGGSR